MTLRSNYNEVHDTCDLQALRVSPSRYQTAWQIVYVVGFPEKRQRTGKPCQLGEITDRVIVLYMREPHNCALIQKEEGEKQRKT